MGLGGNARPHPGPLPQERGKHAQFREFSRPLVWNCFMGTYVGCYGSRVQCAKLIEHRNHWTGTRRPGHKGSLQRMIPMRRYTNYLLRLLLLLVAAACLAATPRPNIVLIYSDDVGYGDVGCYGATRVKTPNIDKLATGGLRFTDAHSPSATCTPSRYALLTGEYAWRHPGTGIAAGDAPLVIPTNYTTLPSLLKRAGYATAAIGKWHLGLGPPSGPDWNAELRPG